MADGYEVVAAELHTHAGSVGQVSAEVDGARSAASAVTLGAEAYGQLCSWLPGLITPVQQSAVDVLAEAAAALDATAVSLGRTAESYTQVDTGAAAGFDGMIAS